MQILKMKTMFMLCNTFLSVLLLFDDSGSAGQMHTFFYYYFNDLN